MSRTKGITAVIRSLGGGGAERVLATMLNYWAERGVPVSLITTTLSCEHVYPLHQDIRCIAIPAIPTPNNLDNCPWDVRHLRQAIMTEGNATVISFMEKSNLPCILAISGLPVRLVLAERTDPRMQHEFSEYKKALIRRLYPLADALVVQTQSVKQWFLDFMPEDKVHIIRNMVNVDTSNTYPDLHLPEKFICCMGRLTPCKGLSGLIGQLPDIFRRHPDYALIILGEGPDRADLAVQVSALGLTKKVLMPGFLSAPHSILEKASVFVLPSVFEGFPNALLEAMALGVPSVSFDCASGPAEIVETGINGILVESQNYEALRDAILSILESQEIRDTLSENAKMCVEERYNTSIIMQEWDKISHMQPEIQYV